ncbi:MAG: tyrosine-type recombinase/integrase [Phycisphaerales bacterium]
MASISRDKNGTKRIMFIDASKKRHTIRMGKVSVKAAEAFKIRVESLITAHRTGTTIDAQTADWVASLPDEIHDRLLKAQLVKPRLHHKQHTLGDLLSACFDSMSVKDSTMTRYKQSRRILFERFGEGRPLEDISSRDADSYRTWLEAKGYSQAKVSKEISIARMFFKQAVRWEMIPSNPFEGVRAGSQVNRERLHYVTPEIAHKLIQSAPDADWRCIIALARFGGLRCPSEVLGVQWGDVNWAENRMRVRSPKTERHIGKAERIIPLFPELRAVLMDAYELAPAGSVYVVGRYRDATQNLGTHFKRIINRAGITPWPRLFNAMRASRVTELAAEYPSAVCTSWMGHTRAVAEAHYHMVRDEDFEKAASEPTLAPGQRTSTQSVAKSGALVSQNASQQQAATTSKWDEMSSQIDKGPAFMPVPSTCCHSLQNDGNGLTRT